ncbi:Potassium voltage-gated channel protein Shal [Eufriesea mexicana]|uniref:Potassium voltage-gated channel protein Shal n=1 Tax=Eufriesea mexicana TaxID=516756 RepID=A0A310S4C5_9HYME|nr:Potassium voltage-gated channel protein Shal [Eufriesea mexicana]
MKLLVSTRGPCWAVAGQDRHFASQPHGVELNHPCGLTVDGTSPSASMCPSPSRVRLRQRTAPSRSEDALIRGGHPGTRCMTRLTVTGNECRRRVVRMTYEACTYRVHESTSRRLVGLRSQHSELETQIPNLELRPRISDLRVQNSEIRALNTGVRAQNYKQRSHSSKLRASNDFVNKARLARIRIAKASSGAAFVSKKKAAEARLAAQESGLQLDDNFKEEDIFELQHHHLLRCLEKTTVRSQKSLIFTPRKAHQSSLAKPGLCNFLAIIRDTCHDCHVTPVQCHDATVQAGRVKTNNSAAMRRLAVIDAEAFASLSPIQGPSFTPLTLC